MWSVTSASHLVSKSPTGHSLYNLEKSRRFYVHKRLIKEWEVGGCERNFTVFVWDKSLSTFLHLALVGYFSGTAEMEGRVGGVHCCARSQKHPGRRGPEDKRTPGLESHPRSSFGAWLGRVAQSLSNGIIKMFRVRINYSAIWEKKQTLNFKPPKHADCFTSYLMLSL